MKKIKNLLILSLIISMFIPNTVFAAASTASQTNPILQVWEALHPLPTSIQDRITQLEVSEATDAYLLNNQTPPINSRRDKIHYTFMSNDGIWAMKYLTSEEIAMWATDWGYECDMEEMEDGSFWLSIYIKDWKNTKRVQVDDPIAKSIRNIKNAFKKGAKDGATEKGTFIEGALEAGAQSEANGDSESKQDIEAIKGGVANVAKNAAKGAATEGLKSIIEESKKAKDVKNGSEGATYVETQTAYIINEYHFPKDAEFADYMRERKYIGNRDNLKSTYDKTYTKVYDIKGCSYSVYNKDDLYIIGPILFNNNEYQTYYIYSQKEPTSFIKSIYNAYK